MTNQFFVSKTQIVCDFFPNRLMIPAVLPPEQARDLDRKTTNLHYIICIFIGYSRTNEKSCFMVIKIASLGIPWVDVKVGTTVLKSGYDPRFLSVLKSRDLTRPVYVQSFSQACKYWSRMPVLLLNVFLIILMIRVLLFHLSWCLLYLK